MVETPLIMFAGYVVDRENEQLRLDNQPLRLTNKAFAVLRHLVEHPGQLVTKEALFAAIWPRTVVTETTLTNCISEVRRALGDDPKQPRFIETVHRRGYRFLPTITAQPVFSSESRVSSSSPPLVPNTQDPAPILVGREAELIQLHELFKKTLHGERQIVFVTGEAGIGKTALIAAFRQRLETRDSPPPPKPLASPVSFAQGQCIEQYGAGEAYLPVLEALGRLGRQPGGERLLAVLRQYAPTWLAQLPALLSPEELEAVQRRIQGATRERMLREITEAVEVLSGAQPLVLVLEDLHWSDPSTVELLTMLARRREPAQLFIVGTYRAAELAVSNHPLKTVKQELVARKQAAEIALSFLSPAAVREYISHRLGESTVADSLANVVYRRTDGQPLFMVQVTDYLVQRDGSLASATADLTGVEQALPPGLREAIEAQLGRLSEDEQSVLAVGSVGGAEFAVASLAAGLAREEATIEEVCDRLARRGQFIEERGVMTWPDGTVSGSYGFRHALYQEVVYTRLPEARRVRWHTAIGKRLEAGYGEQTNEIAAELAMHFERGRDPQRAVQYFSLAVQTALGRSAYQEARLLITRALELLKLWPDTQERIQQELALRFRLATILMATKGYTSAEVEEAFACTRLLCQQAGNGEYLLPVLRGLWAFEYTRGDIHAAHALAQQVLVLAHERADAVLLLEAYQSVGHTLFAQGEFVHAQDQLQQSMSLYDPEKSAVHLAMYGRDVRMVSHLYEALICVYRGYVQQALQCCAVSRASAEELQHPFSQIFAFIYTARIYQFLQDVQATYQWTQTATALASKYGIEHWKRRTETLLDWIREAQTTTLDSTFLMQQKEWTKRAVALGVWVTYEYAHIAAAYGRWGYTELGLDIIQKGLSVSHTKGERFYEAELYRLKGELTLQSQVQSLQSKVTESRPLTPDPQGEAEAYFLKAIEVARRQQAKSLELRATVSLARLRQQQGKRDEARQMLAGIYNWFTEGFNTADLKEAKVLLAELA